MSDDLFDDPVLADPATPPAKEPAAQPPQGQDLAELTHGFQQVAAAVRGIGDRVAGLETRMTQPPATQPSGKGADALTELMADPEQFLGSRIEKTVGKVVEDALGRLAPFLETVADSATSTARERVRTEYDGRFGSGVFDAVIGGELDKALSTLPAASRAKPDYVAALAAGVFGGQLKTPEGEKTFRDARKAARERTAPATLLTGASRQSPEKMTLGDDERLAIDKLAKAGIAFSEEAFLDSMRRGDSEEDWGATWMKKDSYYNELTDPGAKPNGKGA